MRQGKAPRHTGDRGGIDRPQPARPSRRSRYRSIRRGRAGVIRTRVNRRPLIRVAATCDRATATYRILDVEGQTLIVLAHVWGQTRPDQAAELEEMVDSVEIEVKGS